MPAGAHASRASSDSAPPPASAEAKNSGSSVERRGPSSRAGSPLAAIPGQVHGRPAPVVAGDPRRALDVELELRAGAGGRRRTTDPSPARRSAPTGERMPGGQRHRHRLQQQVEHRERVVGDAAMAFTRVAGGHPCDHQRRAVERERRVGRVERRHAPVPERRGRPDDPGAGAAHAPRPSRARDRPWWIAPAVVIASASPPKAAAGGDVAGQQASPAQLPDRPRVPAGERTALRLDVAEPQPRRLAARTPRPAARAGRAARAPPPAAPTAARACSSSTGSTACCRLV